LTPSELRDAAVNEWERHQEQLRSGPASTTTKPVVDTRTDRPESVVGTRTPQLQPDAADNEQLHQHINRPADLSITALAAAITKVLSGAVAPVVIQPTIGLGTDSDGIGGIDDG